MYPLPFWFYGFSDFFKNSIKKKNARAPSLRRASGRRRNNECPEGPPPWTCRWPPGGWAEGKPSAGLIRPGEGAVGRKVACRPSFDFAEGEARRRSAKKGPSLPFPSAERTGARGVPERLSLRHFGVKYPIFSNV